MNLLPPERIGGEFVSSALTDEEGKSLVYKSKGHGVQFQIPLGWTVQEPPKTNAEQPDIVALGPQEDGDYPDSLTLTVRNTNGMTFAQLQTEKINQLQPMIDAGSLALHYSGTDNVNGRDVFSMYAQGAFEDTTNNIFADILFAEVMIYDTPKYYSISTSSDKLGGFDKQVQNLETAVYTFAILSEEQKSVGGDTTQTYPPTAEEQGGGCLIATAAYGSEMAPQVQFLRELRDNTVLQTQSGTAFMTGFNQFYYSFSPAVADYERENPMFKEAVKVTLTPLLTSLAILNYVDIDTEQEMLGYGIGVILLNIGMYFVAPAAVIIAIKNRRK